jgi:hypothetical protein
MNYKALLAVIFVLMPVAAKAQTTSGTARTSDADIDLYGQTVLRDLHHLYISVALSEQEAALNIDRNLLSSLVFSAIKRTLPTIKISNDHPHENAYSQPFLGFMYLRVSCLVDTNISGCYVEISVERAVRVLSEDGTRYVGDLQMVKVWSKEQMFLGGNYPMHKQIEDSVSEMMSKFAADYSKQNSAAQ